MSDAAGGIVVAALWVAREIVAAFAKSRRQQRRIPTEDRKLLSLDEREFRHEVLAELRYMRVELATCQKQHADAVLGRLALAEKLAGTNRRLERITDAAIAGGIVLDPEV